MGVETTALLLDGSELAAESTEDFKAVSARVRLGVAVNLPLGHPSPTSVIRECGHTEDVELLAALLAY